jgi:hypothetical protein
MIGIIIIVLLILILIFITSDKINNLKNISGNKETKINLITKQKPICKKYKKYVYPPPQYYNFKPEEFESDEDKFIFDYVYKSKLYKDYKKEDLNNTQLATYRDRFFDFRNKTNIDSNMITPVDNINEMILLKPDLQDKSIGDIYDSLTSNNQNVLMINNIDNN